MPRKLACLVGHSWDAPDGTHDPVCPVCARPAEIPTPAATFSDQPTGQPDGSAGTPTLTPHPPHDTGTASHDPRLIDLLVKWESATTQGSPVSPEALCADCPELLAEFRRLIENVGAVNDVLVGKSAPPPVLTRVGEYEILEELGRGGMGVVYKARQLTLNRVVALKMILDGGLAGLWERDRFRLEAEAVARLQHPNIVQVHEVGEHDGRPFFSLEFCPGGSLKQKLAGGPLPPREAAGLAESLARGMAAAHARGVVHRDLKPANVLLGADGTPKVADFGLAKLLDSDSGQTATQAVLGTPSYMSPEQASGNSRDVGPASDVYSLGAVLYEMLTGRPPFRGGSMAETLSQVRSQEASSIRRLQPRVPRDLETVCLKCLQKEPGRRYPSADALAEDLRRYLEGKPVRARAVGRVERAGKWVKRNPALTAALVVVALALVTGTVVSTLFAVEAARKAGDADRAAAGERSAREQAETREGEAVEARNDAITSKNLAVRSERAAVLSRNEAVQSKNAADRARNDLAIKAAALEVQVYKSRVALAHQEWQLVGARSARALLDACPPALRGWEWDYVNRLCRLEKARTGFRAQPLALSVRPDGRHVALAFRDGVLRVYDTETLREVAESYHPRPMNEIQHGRVVAYSPDGTILASVIAPDTVYLLDAKDPTKELGLLRDAKEHLERFSAVAFSPDGKTLATVGGQEGIVPSYTLKLWSVADRKLLKTFKGHKNSLTAVAFHPTNGRVATASIDQRVLFWDPDKDAPVLELRTHPGPVWAAVFSPDGKRLATGCEDGTIRLWDATSGKLVADLEGHAGRVTALAFGPDGTRLASSSRDDSIKVWNPTTGRELFALRGHRSRVLDVGYSVGGAELVAVSDDSDLRVWDATRDRQQRVFADHPLQLREGLYSPKGRRIAVLAGFSATEQPAVYLYDAKSGTRERVVSLKSDVSPWLPAVCMAFHPEEKLLATGSGHTPPLGEVVVCDPATGTVVWRRSVLGDRVKALEFSPDGRHLAVAAPGVKRVAILEAFTGREVRSLVLPGDGAQAMAYSADGKQFAAVEAAGPVHVWRTDTWERVHVLPANPGGWEAGRVLAFHPHGKYLAVGAAGNQVILYDPASGREVRRLLRGHASAVGCVTFSPDGRRLFTSGCQDRFVKVWDPDLGEELFTLRGFRDAVYAVTPSPDGRKLLVTTTGLSAHEFDATPPDR